MNTQVSASVFSIAVHALIVAAFLVLSRSMPEHKLLVLDFSLTEMQESKAGATSDTLKKTSVINRRPTAENRKSKVTGRKPEMKAAEERPVRPSPDDVHAAPATDTHAPVPADTPQDTPYVAAPFVSEEEASNTSTGNTIRGAAEASVRDASVHAEGRKAAYLREHFTYIRDTIMKNLSYPQAARKMGWTGKVIISFVICENGDAEDIKIIESSGFGILDRNALETVRKVLPFPQPPLRAEIVIPVAYRLN